MVDHAPTLWLAGGAPLARVDASLTAQRGAQARTEWLPLAALASHAPAWQALAARALEPNVFYEPDFALAAAEAFGRRAGAVLVWSSRAPARLIGLFPARIQHRRYGLGPAVLAGWTHAFAPLGVPLVDRQHASEAIAAWLDHLGGTPELPRLVLLPYLAEGPFAAALRAVLAARGGRAAAFGVQARALLAPADNRSRYLERALPAKKRKELRRQRRRLGAEGAVRLSMAATAPEITAALSDLMALELRGWKGAAGTAAAQHPTVSRFMRRAVLALAAHGQAQVLRLHAGDQPIAAAIVLRSGGTAWFWKIAYDEAFARGSPGVQLALDLTDALLVDGSIARADSCAVPHHPMIDHIWRERLPLADLLIAPDGSATRLFVLARALEHARHAAIAAAKWARARLRGR